MTLRSACIAFALLLLSSAPALGQWNPSFTASLGRGYGNIALSQSILSNTRGLSNSQQPTGHDAAGSNAPAGTMGTAATERPSARGPGSLAPGAAGAPTLTYIPDQAVSDRIREETVVALSQTLPHLRGQMEESFAGNTVLKEFDHRMASKGYSSHNVADDMAELLVASWEITTGGAAQDVQIQGAHRQVRDIFLGNARLRAMTNTERQEALGFLMENLRPRERKVLERCAYARHLKRRLHHTECHERERDGVAANHPLPVLLDQAAANRHDCE